MRCGVQRVTEAAVRIGGEVVGQTGKGFLLLIGVEVGDKDEDLDYIARKVPNLRIFEDENGKMNRSLLDVGGDILAVSQFTLLGDARGGRRPSFITARGCRPDVRGAGGTLAQRGRPCGNGPFRGGDEGQSGERRAGHDSAGFPENPVILPYFILQ